MKPLYTLGYRDSKKHVYYMHPYTSIYILHTKKLAYKYTKNSVLIKKIIIQHMFENYVLFRQLNLLILTISL